MRPSAYHRLSSARKETRAREAMREPAVVCPGCETSTSASDLLAHIERCSGPRAPHPSSRWISWRQAIDLGLSRRTLARWVARDEVRADGTRLHGRRYLLRDVVQRMALRRVGPR